MLGQVVCQSRVHICNGRGAEQVDGMEELSILCEVPVLSWREYPKLRCIIGKGFQAYPIPKPWDGMAMASLNGWLRCRREDIDKHAVFDSKA